ncbi:MAG: glycosyl hydrolase family 18 protein [Lachnospiraceae bacterium]
MKKKSKKPILIMLGVIVLILLAVLGIGLIKKYTPSKEVKDLKSYFGLENATDTAIILNHEQIEEMGTYVDGILYLDYTLVRERFNQRFYWDKNENLLLYATSKGVVRVEPGNAEYQIGKKKETASYPFVRIDGDDVYIAMELVKQYTNMTYQFFENPNRVIIQTEWGEEKQATASRKTQIRVRGGIKSPILRELKENDTVTVLKEGEDWDQVCTADGINGYMKKRYVENVHAVSVANDLFQEDQIQKIHKDFQINMVWHQVTTADANAGIQNLLQNTKGVNVVSPTWFYLNDNNGNIGSFADRDYVNYCHTNGVEVWGLVSNLVNTNVDTTDVLTHTSKRTNLENQIVAAAIQYELDGINVDLETIKKEAGDSYVQFIRELGLKCANNDIVLSVDNYVPSEFTSYYNRKEQAVFADYIVVMGYDEHYVGSEEGSVASIGFVEKGVSDTLEEVPAQQVILGMPFYTRLWSKAPKQNAKGTKENESYTLNSQALGMKDAESVVAANGAEPQWLDETQQFYVEYENDGVTYQMWMETAESLEKKLGVMKENNLAGGSFWKLGLEKPEVWDTVIKYMQ